MVKIGIICEGPTEEILFLSDSFSNMLASNKLFLAGVINVGGSGNLLPHKIAERIELLQLDGAEKIFIVTDMDADACITMTKQRINAQEQAIVIIAVKTIEAWFLASSETMQKFLNSSDFEFPFPENEPNPFNTINQLLVAHTGRGIGKRRSSNPINGKIKLVTHLLNAGLDISQAASHPNCPSARYFINKLNMASANGVTP